MCVCVVIRESSVESCFFYVLRPQSLFILDHGASVKFRGIKKRICGKSHNLSHRITNLCLICHPSLQNVLQGAAKSTEGIKDKLTAKTKSLNRTQVDTKPVIDQAFRDVLLHLLETECGINTLKEYIVLCVATCKSDLTTPSIPVVLLGDIFDTLTLDVCEEMFMFVEQEVKIWKEDLFFMACKNNLLRMCNDLLRRLSRSSATVFCGRILLFLAKFFPFSERSGLNIVSEFNLENVTDYKSGDIADNSETMEITEAKTSVVIDYSLYCKFWSLQDFFRNPNQCYNRMQWKVFCSVSTHLQLLRKKHQHFQVSFCSTQLVSWIPFKAWN